MKLLAVIGASLLVLGVACSTGASKEEVSALSDNLDSVTENLGTANAQLASLAQPKTHHLSIRLGEGAIIGPNDTIIGAYYRWEPETLVVMKGDKIVLHVENPLSKVHSFLLEEFQVNTEQIAPGASATVEFVAGKTGVFQYRCGVRYDASQGHCDPDHRRQVGQLIVLER